MRTHHTNLNHNSIPVSMDSSNLSLHLQIHSLVYSQRQVNSIYFDFSNTFDLVLQVLLFRKLDDFGLSPGSTVTLPTDYPMFAIVTQFRHCMKRYPVCHKDISEATSFQYFHTWFMQCGEVFKLYSLCRRHKKISRNKQPVVTSVSYK